MLMHKHISLVIPILNERAALPELLAALLSQTLKPTEILFVDAGSTDGSQEYIESWWQRSAWDGASCRILSQPGALPGAGRNAGIGAANCEWVAFLDGGITPQPEWLEMLCRMADRDKAPAVLGTCQFRGRGAFEKAMCALSYGQGQTHAVLPVSLFHRTVFDRVGVFRPDLRAGEDILWQSQLRSVLGDIPICHEARAHYTYFPASLPQAFRKWRVAEFNCVRAKVRRRQIPVYLLVVPLTYIMLFAGGWTGGIWFGTYVLLRGAIDPIRRSSNWRWWGETPGAFWIPLWLAPLLDLAKLTGIIEGLGHSAASFSKERIKCNG